jgi:hypothetical protein
MSQPAELFNSFRDDNFNATSWVNAALAATDGAGIHSRSHGAHSDDTHISALIAKLQVLTQVRALLSWHAAIPPSMFQW